MTLPLIKAACGLVESASRIRGTGFLIAADRVLTCRHVVPDAAPTHSLKVHFLSGAVEARIETWSDERDWAVLRLQRPMEDIAPLRLGTGRPAQQAQWESFGYPAATLQSPLPLDGSVLDADGLDTRGRVALVLRCPMLSSNSAPQGFSGSPVIVDGLVVGMLQSIAPDQQKNAQFEILYACPIDVLNGVLEGSQAEATEVRLERQNQDRWTELLIGIPSTAAESIRALLSKYLGTERHLVAFGGRAETLSSLHRWAEEDIPYLFLVAPTGRGKSALVCRFVDQLLARTDTALAFLPISQAFGTSLAGDALPALMGRLSFLYRALPPKDLSLPVVRAWLAQHLRQRLPDGRRLVLILDGLDEADDWSLPPGALPSDLAPTTRVLVAARETADRDAEKLRMAFQLPRPLVKSLPLDALDLAGVRDALMSLEPLLGPLWEDVALLRRLLELSEGDPLVLELLLDELQTPFGNRDLLADQIDLTPGLQGVWERMARASEQGAFEPDSPSWRLIGALVCALAPLSRDSLIELAGLETAAAFDRALRPVSRWIRRTPAGHVFNHKRLREFLYEEKLSKKERHDWETRLLAWIERVLAQLPAQSAQAEVPDYILQCYSAHLFRAGVGIEKWLQLLTTRWRSLWDTRPEGMTGLNRDVDRVISAIETPQGSASPARVEELPLKELLRARLWKASIRSQAQSIPPAVLKQLVERGLWTPAQALAHARYLMDADENDLRHAEPIVLSVLELLPNSLLRDGMELACESADRQEASELKLWHSLLPRVVQVMPDLAAMYARCLRHSFHQIRILLALADALPKERDALTSELRRDALSRIMQLKLLPKPFGFLNAVSEFARRFSPEQQADLNRNAYELTREVTQDEARASYLRSLVKRLGPDERDVAFLDALETACRCKEAYQAALILEDLEQVDREVGVRGLRAVLGYPRMDAMLAWLGDTQRGSSEQRWALLRNRLKEDEVDRVTKAALEAAANTWLTHSFLDPLLLLAEHGHRAQVLHHIRQTPDPQQRQLGLRLAIKLLDPEERLTLWRDQLQEKRGLAAQRVAIDLVADLPAQGRAAVERVLAEAADPAAKLAGLLALARSLDVAERAPLLEEVERCILVDVDGQETRQQLIVQLFYLRSTERCLRKVLDIALQGAPRWNAVPFELIRLATDVGEPHRRWVQEAMVEGLRQMPASLQSTVLDFQFLELPPDLHVQVEEIRKEAERRIPWSRPRRAELGPSAVKDIPKDGKELRAALEGARIIGDEVVRISAVAAVCSSEEYFRALVRRAEELKAPEQRFHSLAHLLRHAEARYSAEFAAPIAAAAVIEARLLIDHPNILARSFIMYRGSKEIRLAVAKESLGVAELALRPHEAILKHWQGMSEEESEHAYYDLPPNVQRDFNDASRILKDVGPFLEPEDAELWLSKTPRFWSEPRGALFRAIPPERRESILEEEWRWASSREGSRRAGAMAPLVPLLPQPRRAAAVHEVLGTTLVVQRRGGSKGDYRPFVLSVVAEALLPEHLASAMELAATTWPSAMNNLHIFLMRLPSALRPAALDLLSARLKTLDESNRHEVESTLKILLLDRSAGLSLLEYEASLKREALQRFVAASEIWDENRLTDVLRALRTLHRPTGWTDRAQEAQYQLLSARIKTSRKLRHAETEHVRAVLAQRGQTRPSLLAALESLGPSLRALGGPQGADALAEEVLKIDVDWP